MNDNLRQPTGAERLLLTAAESAELLGISHDHLRRMADSGAAPRPVHIGRAVRWRRSDLEAWIEDGCQPVRSTPARPRRSIR